MMTIDEAVATVAARFGITPEREADGTWTLGVPASDEVANAEEEGEVVLVSVYADVVDWGPAEGLEVLVARADAGDLGSEEDGNALLVEPASMWFGRLYADESGALYAEAAVPLSGDPGSFAQAVQEAADLATSAGGQFEGE